MKRVSISRKLFRIYTLLFGIFFLFSVIAAVAYMSMSIHKSIIQTQMMLTDTISQAIEGYFDDMNEFSMTLMNSYDFKNAVINELPRSLNDGALQNRAILTIYSVAYQMFEKEYRIGIETQDGIYIWLADQIIVKPLNRHVSRYDDYDGYGKPVLLPLDGNNYLACVEGALKASISMKPPSRCPAASISEINSLSRKHIWKFMWEKVILSSFCRNS